MTEIQQELIRIVSVIESLNNREGQSAYTYSSHLIVTSALYIYTYIGALYKVPL